MLIQLLPPQHLPVSGATCPNCGSTNTHVLRIEEDGKRVKTMFECSSCGNVW